MDWTALGVSLQLAALTALVLAPVGLIGGRLLAYRRFRGRSLVEALLLLPLVLPPTVLGYYLLVGLGGGSLLGRTLEVLVGRQLVFSFGGLVIASAIVNLAFAVQPMQRAFEAIPRDVREAAACCGMAPWRAFARIEIPLAWPGVVSALLLVFVHTLGEFGVVLMVGGSIPGETRTVSIAIYDRVQALDEASAAVMSAALLAFSLVTVAATYLLSGRLERDG